jgi:CBS domain-containing protein
MQMTVSQLMSRTPNIVRHDATVGEAIPLMLDDSPPQLDVVDGDGRLVGSVPDYELLKAQMAGDLDRPVSALMTSAPARIDSAMTVAFVAGVFRDGRYRRLPVVERGRVVGQIDRRDVMRLLHAGTSSVEHDAHVAQNELHVGPDVLLRSRIPQQV